MNGKYLGDMKKCLINAVCTVGGLVFCGLLIMFGLLYIAVCAIRELADYLLGKAKRS